MDALLHLYDQHLPVTARGAIAERVLPGYTAAAAQITANPTCAPNHPVEVVIEVLRQTSDPDLVAALAAADVRTQVNYAAAAHPNRQPTITTVAPGQLPPATRTLVEQLDHTLERLAAGSLTIDTAAELLTYLDASQHHKVLNHLPLPARPHWKAAVDVPAVTGVVQRVANGTLHAELATDILNRSRVAFTTRRDAVTHFIARGGEVTGHLVDFLAATHTLHQLSGALAEHRGASAAITPQGAIAARHYIDTTKPSIGGQGDLEAATIIAVAGRTLTLPTAHLDHLTHLGWRHLARLAPPDVLEQLIASDPPFHRATQRCCYQPSFCAGLADRADTIALMPPDIRRAAVRHCVASDVTVAALSLLTFKRMFADVDEQTACFLDALEHTTSRHRVLDSAIRDLTAQGHHELAANIIWHLHDGVDYIERRRDTLAKPVGEQLTTRTLDRLGDQPDRWDTLLELARRWSGSLADLVDTVWRIDQPDR